MGDLLDLLDQRFLLVMMTFVTLIFIILVIILWRKLNRLRTTYLNMMNGEGSMNVEQALIELQDKTAKLSERNSETLQKIQMVTEHLKTMKSNIGIYRYNAFAESGSDLSFSVAILDELQDGIVLTGIHNRDETYVYAKPLTKGESKYTLSPEEKEAIHRCVPKKLP